MPVPDTNKKLEDVQNDLKKIKEKLTIKDPGGNDVVFFDTKERIYVNLLEDKLKEFQDKPEYASVTLKANLNLPKVIDRDSANAYLQKIPSLIKEIEGIKNKEDLKKDIGEVNKFLDQLIRPDEQEKIEALKKAIAKMPPNLVLSTGIPKVTNGNTASEFIKGIPNLLQLIDSETIKYNAAQAPKSGLEARLANVESSANSMSRSATTATPTSNNSSMLSQRNIVKQRQRAESNPVQASPNVEPPETPPASTTVKKHRVK